MIFFPAASIYAKAFCQQAKLPLNVIRKGMKKPQMRKEKRSFLQYGNLKKKSVQFNLNGLKIKLE